MRNLCFLSRQQEDLSCCTYLHGSTLLCTQLHIPDSLVQYIDQSPLCYKLHTSFCSGILFQKNALCQSQLLQPRHLLENRHDHWHWSSSPLLIYFGNRHKKLYYRTPNTVTVRLCKQQSKLKSLSDNWHSVLFIGVCLCVMVQKNEWIKSVNGYDSLSVLVHLWYTRKQWYGLLLNFRDHGIKASAQHPSSINSW